MAPDYLLGVDLGTSSVKAVLVDRQGDIAAQASEIYDIDSPHPGWAEQDPEKWYSLTAAAIRRVFSISGIPVDAAAGVGLSGQMHGSVCLDAQGRLIRPAVIWADQRSREQVDRLNRLIGKENLVAWTGGPLAAGFMLSTWIWLREKEPEAARETRHLLLPKDYLRWRMTGQMGSESSDASSTGMFDTANRSWSAPLLDFLEIDPELLPFINESASPAGEITRQVSVDTGLKPGTPVVFGGSDQSCQALGHGIYDPGSISCTIGTGGQLFAALDKPISDPELRLHLFCHSLPDRWHQLAAILAAGLSLKWLRGLLSPEESFQSLADSAAAISPGSEGLFFLPYLAGERTPHMDPSVRGAFIGLTLRHNRAHLVRAVMEGVVFALRQGLDLMVENGVRIERIVASGGAVVHPLWRELLANVFKSEISLTGVQEASAVGAALLAGVGVGFYPDVRSGSQSWSKPQPPPFLPDHRRSEIYEETYQQYTGLYPALKKGALWDSPIRG
jgi:xylulokinase